MSAPEKRELHWLEVNVHLPGGRAASREFMVERIFPLVREVKKRFDVESFHYFLEPEVRIRFYAARIEKVHAFLDATLTEWVKRGWAEKVVFGKHGQPGAYYDGEEEYWGKEEWPIAMRTYQNGSEMAMMLMDLKIPNHRVQHHLERYIHLMLNQVGYGYKAEADLYSMLHDDAYTAWIMANVSAAIGAGQQPREKKPTRKKKEAMFKR